MSAMPHLHRPTTVLTALVAALLVAGCVTQSEVPADIVNYYSSPELDISPLRRVVVVPFDYHTGDQKAVQTVSKAFVQKLQEQGRFEVVYQPEVLKDLDEEVKLWERGRVNLAVLAKVSEKYSADAFIFGTITQYRPYDPPVLGLKVYLATASKGEIAWQADAVFDSKKTEVADAVKRYYKRRYGEDSDFYGWKIMLLSIDRFAEFACDAMVAKM